MDIEANLALFRELMLAAGNVYSWTYDAQGGLISSNCPDQAVLATVFDTFGCLAKMLELGGARSRPTFLSTDMGLVWGAAFEKSESGELLRCHVIGPVFYSSVSMAMISTGVRARSLRGYSAAWQDAFYQALYRVPTSQFTIFARNLQMLHLCVTGERVEISDVFVDDIAPAKTEQAAPRDRHRIWQAETALLMMVQRGDLNYRDALSTSMLISDGVSLDTRDPIRNAKTNVIVFSSIVCRAAILGGLSPEEAYSVGDAYIRSAEGAHTIDELSSISMTMYDDFIHRVHKRREKPRCSEPIRRCCQYIEMHPEKNIRAKELAELVSYSQTHLTRRFREETGMGIPDYARMVRVERAKVLLETSDLSVQEISDQLGFSTRNYFSLCFRQETGMTPTQFREKR